MSTILLQRFIELQPALCRYFCDLYADTLFFSVLVELAAAGANYTLRNFKYKYLKLQGMFELSASYRYFLCVLINSLWGPLKVRRNET